MRSRKPDRQIQRDFSYVLNSSIIPQIICEIIIIFHKYVLSTVVTNHSGLNDSLFSFPPEIREAFKVFDRDGNGFISKQELGTAMRSLGYMPNEVELEVIIQRLDMDGKAFFFGWRLLFLWVTLRTVPSMLSLTLISVNLAGRTLESFACLCNLTYSLELPIQTLVTHSFSRQIFRLADDVKSLIAPAIAVLEPYNGYNMGRFRISLSIRPSDVSYISSRLRRIQRDAKFGVPW